MIAYDCYDYHYWRAILKRAVSFVLSNTLILGLCTWDSAQQVRELKGMSHTAARLFTWDSLHLISRHIYFSDSCASCLQGEVVFRMSPNGILQIQLFVLERWMRLDTIRLPHAICTISYVCQTLIRYLCKTRSTIPSYDSIEMSFWAFPYPFAGLSTIKPFKHSRGSRSHLVMSH